MRNMSLLEQILAGAGELTEDQVLFATFAQVAREVRGADVDLKLTDQDDYARYEVLEGEWPGDERLEGPVVRDVAVERRAASAGPEEEDGRPITAVHEGEGWRLAWRFPTWEVRLQGPGPATVRIGDTELHLEVGVWVRRDKGKPPEAVEVVPDDGGASVVLPRVK